MILTQEAQGPLVPFPCPGANWLHATALEFNKVEGEEDGNCPGSFCKITHRHATLKFFSGFPGSEESGTAGNILR